MEQVNDESIKYFNGDDLAANVFVTKYALKQKTGEYVEQTPHEMHQRLAKEFARIEKKFDSNFNSSSSLQYEEIFNLLKEFKYVVPQGSPMMGIGNDYVNVSLSNCVVVESPDDNISSIVNTGKHLANLFKRRCGVGLDISTLRPDNTPVSNSAGTTTGAWSFADFYSYVCRMIGQNGRRGALMITMDIRHPDIERFVTMKNDLTKVTGANVSVKINDSFMSAVENKQSFTLKFPVDADESEATFIKVIDANELWSLIVDSATKTAEPGILMWDNVIQNLPAECYIDDGFKTVSTNPCAEIPLSAYDSCRLISINLKNFVNDRFQSTASFDFQLFESVVKKAMRLSDDLVELELEKLESICRITDTRDEQALWKNLFVAAKKGRRTGLGTHGLADTLACMQLAYDSDAAMEVIDRIYETLKISAYEESVALARERGTFECFDWSKEKDNNFINSLPKKLRDMMKVYGRRNISILTNAPTGSVSIMSQTSSGLEPVFRNSYIRRRKLNHNETGVVPDFIDDLGDGWVEYTVHHHNVQDWIDIHGNVQLPDFFITSDQIDWKRRVEIQATIQKHIDHAISSTINLPAGTEPSVVGELYMLGWKLGLKGVTIYVDGSRTGVLVTERKKESFPQTTSPTRPQDLKCDIHHTTIKGEKWIILVGLMGEKPYEVLGGEANLIEIPKKYVKGRLTKHQFKTKNNRYDLSFGYNGDTIVIKDVVKVFDNPNNSAFTRLISLALRHGAKPSFLVEQLQKDRDSDMFSFAKCIARILKSYIIDGEAVCSDKMCSSCGEEELVYMDGCVSCLKCGWSKCS
jgi:ribonucleoside-diphosphate reductase alpha chain